LFQPHAALASGLSATRGCTNVGCLEPLGSQRGQRARQIRGSLTMVTLVRVCHQVRGTGLALLSFTISPTHPPLSPLPRWAWWLPSGAEPYVVTQENCEDPSAKVQIPQPFREGRCAPRQSNLGKVISLVRSLLIRAHGYPQLSLSIF